MRLNHGCINPIQQKFFPLEFSLVWSLNRKFWKVLWIYGINYFNLFYVYLLQMFKVVISKWGLECFTIAFLSKKTENSCFVHFTKKDQKRLLKPLVVKVLSIRFQINYSKYWREDDFLLIPPGTYKCMVQEEWKEENLPHST